MANFRQVGGGNVPVSYKTIATAAANQTYAAQLTQLKATYDTLTDDEKMRSVLYTGGRILYNYNTSLGIFAYLIIYSTAFSPIDSAVLSTSKYFGKENNTVNDYSDQNNNAEIKLMLLSNY